MDRSRAQLGAAWVLHFLFWVVLPFDAAQAQSAKVGDVKKVPAAVAIPAGPQSQSLRVSRFFVQPTNEVVGQRREGFFCGGDGEIRFSQALGAQVMQQAGLVVRRELQQAGYPQQAESAFESQRTDSAVEYELAGTLVGVQAKVCMDGNTVRRGDIWLSIDWELYAPRERRVVYRVTREGSHSVDEPQALVDFFRLALQSTARSLLADARFHAQVSQRASAVPATSQNEALPMVRRHAGGGSVAERMPQLQSAVATVFAGTGSGSGFYIGHDGFWLTNHHVVGDARFVRIRLANGRELNGEVLRTAVRRDVALIKTEPVTLAPMEVTESEPPTGSEVTALGSPLGERFASSVARGVVSSYRDIDQLRWLQSDVQILPGSSGGPLVSAEGAVVGIATLGTVGIGMFVPIRDAMQALNLVFAAPTR